jgi:hypothetical protein
MNVTSVTRGVFAARSAGTGGERDTDPWSDGVGHSGRACLDVHWACACEDGDEMVGPEATSWERCAAGIGAHLAMAGEVTDGTTRNCGRENGRSTSAAVRGWRPPRCAAGRRLVEW